MKKELIIELIDDLVLSQTSATEGGHQSLDFIPGSAILGAVASKIYKDISQEDAWTLFHSGLISFGNAYPSFNHKRSLPLPLSLHTRKDGVGDPIDFCTSSGTEGIQYQQVREGFNVDSSKIMTTKTQRARTAIDSAKGSALDGQLYSYQSLNAGQKFIAHLSWDEKSNELAQKIVQFFNANSEIRLGRSRTASYGRVKVQLKDMPSKRTFSFDGQSKLHFFAESDLWLRDLKTGMPTLTLTAEHIGLPEDWKILSKGTFTRNRRFSTYNAARNIHQNDNSTCGGIELERVLLQKGSVFSFEGRALNQSDVQKLESCLNKGVGDGLEHGFGRLIPLEQALPKALNHANVDFVEFRDSIDPKDEAWLSWLKGFAIDRTKDLELTQKAEEIFKQYQLLIAKIQSFNGLNNTGYPGKTQWGRVSNEVSNANNKQNLLSRLFSNNDGVISEDAAKDQEWLYQASIQSSDTIRNFLTQLINNNNDDWSNLQIILQRFIKRCQNFADKGGLQ